MNKTVVQWRTNALLIVEEILVSFWGSFRRILVIKKEGVKEEIPFGMKSGAKIPLIFKNCVFRLC